MWKWNWANSISQEGEAHLNKETEVPMLDFGQLLCPERSVNHKDPNLLYFCLKNTLMTQILHCGTTAMPRCSHSASDEPELQIPRLLPSKFHLGSSCSSTVYMTIPIVLWIKVQPKLLTLFVQSCLPQTNLSCLFWLCLSFPLKTTTELWVNSVSFRAEPKGLNTSLQQQRTG